MFEIDQVYNDKFVKFEVSLLISLSQRKEVDIEPFDYRVIFGDENIIGALDVWNCLFKAFPVAYTQFINAHPDRDFELSNPMIARVGGHFEISRYRAVFEIYLEEDTGINDKLTDDDKAVMLRAFYEFDDNIRNKNGLRLTPTAEKQKLYDAHFDVDKVPYMIHDSVPKWEDRPKDTTIELVDITEEMKAERMELTRLKRLYMPTKEDLMIARKEAENKLMLHEDKNTPMDYSQFIYRGPEVVEVMKDKNRY